MPFVESEHIWGVARCDGCGYEWPDEESEHGVIRKDQIDIGSNLFILRDWLFLDDPERYYCLSCWRSYCPECEYEQDIYPGKPCDNCGWWVEVKGN